jgi:error-prone DNA polymerase
MVAKGIARGFAERVFEQIRGFGEYGFPESHAASFALIAYASAWMKCHFPEVFACSLLNAQPMGFYSPATIIDDAKRHGVQVHPVDVMQSGWDCSLETADRGPYRCAIRMGMRYIKGLSQRDWQRIQQARTERRFASAEDFMARTGLNDGMLTRLAEAGALSCFDSQRRSILWQVKGRATTPPSPPELRPAEKLPAFNGLDPFETIDWDYRTMDHSVRGNPLSTLRDKLNACNLPDARSVGLMPDGDRVRYAGMVICRQRPGTASGVVFLTLEDETGFVNVVAWSRVFEKYSLLIKALNFLGVSGKLQKEDRVVHVIADRFWDPQVQIGARPASGGSRDFH